MKPFTSSDTRLPVISRSLTQALVSLALSLTTFSSYGQSRQYWPSTVTITKKVDIEMKNSEGVVMASTSLQPGKSCPVLNARGSKLQVKFGGKPTCIPMASTDFRAAAEKKYKAMNSFSAGAAARANAAGSSSKAGRGTAKLPQGVANSQLNPRPPIGQTGQARANKLSPELAKLLPKQLEKPTGKKSPTENEIGGKLVGLYFSASWCGPCRAFTPKLSSFRNANQDKIEIILVGGDSSAKAQKAYHKKMPWPAIAFGSPEIRSLSQKFGVSGIPRLVILSPEGKVLSSDARGEVMRSPKTALSTWR